MEASGLGRGEAADLSDLRADVPVPDIPAEGDLLRFAGGLREAPDLLVIGVRQDPGQHHERDADAGGQHVRERTHVDDVVGGGQRVEGRRRPGGVQEVVVVIVLQDERRMRFAVLDEFEPPFHGHDIAEAGHVGRGDVDDRRVLVAEVDVEAVVPEPGDALPETLVRERDRPVLREQGAEDVEQRVDTGADNDLVPVGDDVPLHADVFGDRVPQVLFALGLTVRTEPLFLPQGRVDVPVPEGDVEALEVRVAARQVEARLHLAGEVPGRFRRRRLRAGFPGHIVAAAVRRQEEALRLQGEVRVLDRGPADAVDGRRFADGRQTVPVAELAVQDPFFIVFVKLQILLHDVLSVL